VVPAHHRAGLHRQKVIEIVGLCLQSWRIEDYIHVLKSGCSVEFLLFRAADRLQRATAINIVIAWRIMAVTLRGRQVPDREPQSMFTDGELEFVRDYAHKYALKAPERLGDAARLIAYLRRLPGPKARPGPGTPNQWHC